MEANRPLLDACAPDMRKEGKATRVTSSTSSMAVDPAGLPPGPCHQGIPAMGRLPRPQLPKPLAVRMSGPAAAPAWLSPCCASCLLLLLLLPPAAVVCLALAGDCLSSSLLCGLCLRAIIPYPAKGPREDQKRKRVVDRAGRQTHLILQHGRDSCSPLHGVAWHGIHGAVARTTQLSFELIVLQTYCNA